MRWLAIGLAAYRVSRMVTAEIGPGSVFARTRMRAGVYRSGPVSEAAYLFSCPYCFSIWAGAALTILDRYCPAIVTALAASGVASIIFDAAGVPEDAHDERSGM